ncbi:hypothetical protein MPER_09228 [Moniliophthora perniciosa FA553]|nr:hypothetical protein MPER_09228 [Moniliophthora perniciosa FA553]
MAPNPIEIAKKGYEKLQKQVEARKKSLQERLAKNEQLSEADSNWLDNEGNTVDEMVLLDKLEKESDYEQAVERLEPQQKCVLDQLIELGGQGKNTADKVAGAKRKRPEKKQGDPTQKSETATVKTRKTNEPAPKRNQNATNAQRIEVLDFLNGPGKGNQTKTANHFAEKWPTVRINQPLVSTWKKEESNHREIYNANGGASRNAKRRRQTQHPEVTDMMDLWVSKAMHDRILLTGDILRGKWKEFADLVGIPQDERLELSDGWLDKFKKRSVNVFVGAWKMLKGLNRNGLKMHKRHGEAASSSPIAIENERKRIQEIIDRLTKQGYKLRDIFNMDETGLFYA